MPMCGTNDVPSKAARSFSRGRLPFGDVAFDAGGPNPLHMFRGALCAFCGIEGFAALGRFPVWLTALREIPCSKTGLTIVKYGLFFMGQ
jgi:hypothetical protein